MDYRVFSLGSNDGLAEKIAETLGMPLGQVKCRAFSDGEQHVQFLENLRGKNIFLVQSTNPPAEHWIRLLLAIDAARGASAHEITAVIPYFREYFKEALKKDDLVVVSPDAGGTVRAQSYARRLMKSADLAIIHKEREIPNKVARMKLVGDVKGKIALIVDDMADTCGTLARAVELLIENGASEVYAAATHGVFSGAAIQVLEASPIKRVFITDTVSTDRELGSKVEVVSVGKTFGDAIDRIESGESLSALFETE